jgi:protein phosphatase
MSEVSISGQPVILFAEECDRGILRKENQNSVLHVHIALGDLLIVADGVGDEGGATASRMVVEEFYTHLAALPRDYPVRNAIREAIARTNEKILAAAKAPDAPYTRMGSTVVLALIQQEAAGTNAWIGHIGDSRAYLVRAGRMQCLTIDHSAAQVLLSRNLITPEEAQHHPDSTVLTRSLLTAFGDLFRRGTSIGWRRPSILQWKPQPIICSSWLWLLADTTTSASRWRG